MKKLSGPYSQFILWIQVDLKRDRLDVNRKVFSVVLWCLIFPTILSLILFGLKKYHIFEQMRYADTIIFLPPFFYAIYSLWPTLRDLPRVFYKGGLGALLEESLREVEWREKTSTQLLKDLTFTSIEWDAISFHLQKDIESMQEQNRYMTILSAVVLFFMFQFLDLGGSNEFVQEVGPTGLVKVWVDQFAQWSTQVFSLVLFASLFYLSGLQFQRYLRRYLICVQKIILFGLESKKDV